jgi:hypothetical protein
MFPGPLACELVLRTVNPVELHLTEIPESMVQISAAVQDFVDDAANFALAPVSGDSTGSGLVG